MLTITFNNQDYYEGMVNKDQKPFTIDDVSSLEMYGDLSKFVNGNLYLFQGNDRKAVAMINMPILMYYAVERGAKRAFRDTDNDYTVIINCILSKWTVEFERNGCEIIDIDDDLAA